MRAPGAESCVGPIPLSEAVARKLGREAFAKPSRASLAIEGRATRADPGGLWLVTLTVRSNAGEVQGVRELRSAEPDCRALDEEIALVIALLIEPGALLGAAPKPAGPVAQDAPAPEAPAPRAPAPAPAPEAPPQPWRLDAEAGVIGSLGLLPGTVAGGVAVRAHVVPPGWPALEIGGAFWPPRTTGAPVGAAVSLGWGSLGVCPVGVEEESYRLRLCLGGVVGAMVADSIGLSPAARKAQAIFGVAAELRFRRRIVGPLAASAGVGVLYPTVRPQFYYLDTSGAQQDVFQPGSFAGTLDVALNLSFP